MNSGSVAKFGFDTAVDEPFQIFPLSAYRSPRFDVFRGESLGAFAGMLVRRAHSLISDGQCVGRVSGGPSLS